MTTTAIQTAGPDGQTPVRSYAGFNKALIQRFIVRLGSLGHSPLTLRSYSNKLHDFARFLGARSILDVTHAELLEYLTDLHNAGLSKKTIFVYGAALRRLNKFLGLIELPNSGALGRLKPIKCPDRIGEFNTYEQVEALLAAAEMPRDRAIIELCFGAGLRISELAKIRVENINPGEVCTTKILGKGNKEGILYWGSKAEVAIREYLAGRTEGFLFRQEWPFADPRQIRRFRKAVSREWASSGRFGNGKRYLRLGPCSQAEAESKLQEMWLHVSQGRPNKAIATVYWRGNWREYDGPGNGRKRFCWLGKVSELTREEAKAKLAMLLDEKANVDRPILTEREYLRSQKYFDLRMPKRVLADKPLGAKQLSIIVRAIGARAGIKTTVHRLRHAYATEMLNRGVGIRELQVLMRHESISTTARYLHSSPADLLRVHEQFHPHGGNNGENQAG